MRFSVSIYVRLLVLPFVIVYQRDNLLENVKTNRGQYLSCSTKLLSKTCEHFFKTQNYPGKTKTKCI